MSESDEELLVLVDNEESDHPKAGFTVKVVPSAKGEHLRRLVDPLKADGPKYQVRGVEPVEGRLDRSHVDLFRLPPHLQD
jgi:hypothetical protein